MDAIQSYQRIRMQTEVICHPLEIEDYVIQGMEDVSPAKWHLAHTTWFFETFILLPKMPNYMSYNRTYPKLFNSYYQSLGEPLRRASRGLLSRPTVKDIYAYRHHVDKNLQAYLQNCSIDTFESIKEIFELGLHHEQQHQELLLTDIKYNYSLNQLNFPTYNASANKAILESTIALEYFIPMEGGIVSIGFTGPGFSYDNEGPTHKSFLNPYCIANRLVTNGEYLEFIKAKGYQTPSFWLADGWDCINKNHWQAPLYWSNLNDKWCIFTLQGLKEINLNEPVCHVSYYEADAYARWRGKRLPTEIEWEHFTHQASVELTGNFLENNHFHPTQATNQPNIPQQLFGDVWEWTMSAYSPYPGYQAPQGSLGEYNGKFMCNQIVLRGGSCATSFSHIRPSYRNFFQPDKRWQFSGIRLAEDVK